jgi:hypothetical protein
MASHAHAAYDLMDVWLHDTASSLIDAVNADGLTIGDCAQEASDLVHWIMRGGCVLASPHRQTWHRVQDMRHRHSLLAVSAAAIDVVDNLSCPKPVDVDVALAHPESMALAHRLMSHMTDPLAMATWASWLPMAHDARH